MPTREDADELGEVVWKWAHGGTSAARFGSHPEGAVAWLPLPRYTPPTPEPTDTECANLLHYGALVVMNHINPNEDVPLEEQFAMVRRWFAAATARIEREKQT